ncbi:GNAT family N-acetyltransferase [Isoptericola sp. NPDC057653]|uniref:GNAT family N-acetyltransferase n=1 Tax=Isoptericola sp. NPDC057653 TaxID=3346195 RepID=UPI0036C3F791
MLLRDAADSDLDGILTIHNDAIRTSTAIWTDDEVPRSEREAWFAAQRAAGNPVVVADDGGEVAGYATYAQWRAKSGYRHTVEDSIYVADGYRGRGLGRALLVELVARARAAGHRTMLADIEAGNVASVRLHESLGFGSVGRLPEVGTKFGQWLDLEILALPLQDGAETAGVAPRLESVGHDG